MSLTSPYAKLAAIAPGKPKRTKKHLSKKQRAFKKRWHDLTFPKLDAPPGTLRYFLFVPARSIDIALNLGCQFDPRSQRWFIDNPTNLSDLAAWKPSRVGFDKIVKQLKQQPHSPGGDSH